MAEHWDANFIAPLRMHFYRAKNTLWIATKVFSKYLRKQSSGIGYLWHCMIPRSDPGRICGLRINTSALHENSMKVHPSHQQQSLCCLETKNAPWCNNTWLYWWTPSIFLETERWGIQFCSWLRPHTVHTLCAQWDYELASRELTY